MDNGATQPAQAAEQTAARLINEGMRAVAGELANLAGTLRGEAQNMGSEGAAGTVQEAANLAADRVEALSDYLRTAEPDELVASLERIVRRRPLESVLVAAGIGFVLSKVVR